MTIKQEVLVLYLQSGKGKDCNSDAAVAAVSDSFGFASQIETGCPTSDSDDVTTQLKSYMKVKPSRV